MTKLRTELLADNAAALQARGSEAGGRPMAATTIRVSRMILKKVDAEAKAEGLSRNELVVLLFDRYLRERTGEGIEEIDPPFAAFMKVKRRGR
ncbi:ribbon-helix-helix protein, CopG family [Jiella sp. M17.18]|uniref:ribbon-helix-helix protein, CopG family n=1 Tax=Jiella sp. M17.18 TaxID=3234247 RepID=UPI0034DE1576